VCLRPVVVHILPDRYELVEREGIVVRKFRFGCDIPLVGEEMIFV
jgi:hypothetical protein